MRPLDHGIRNCLGLSVRDAHGLVAAEFGGSIRGEDHLAFLRLQEGLETSVALGPGVWRLIDVELGATHQLFDMVHTGAAAAALTPLPSVYAEISQAHIIIPVCFTSGTEVVHTLGITMGRSPSPPGQSQP